MKRLEELTSDDVNKIVQETIQKVNDGSLTRHELKEFIEIELGSDFLKNTIQGHGYTKPYGYAGDFQIIDFIYTYRKSEIDKFRLWDEFFHQQEAPKAVRNRKDYFREKVAQRMREGGTLLNVASGPARELHELYSENPRINIKTTCIDMDENAIEYAKMLNHDYLGKIDFIHKNIFRFNTDNHFDIIWSAGLFDYFDNRAFILLLKRFKKWLKDNGEIIIGNFNENYNPSRAYMEVFGEWYLIHRTEEQLYCLANQAGFADSEISVGCESENVNLFLHLKK